MPTPIRGRPSRAPYPYDLVIRQLSSETDEARVSVGLMLGGTKKGEGGMVSRRPSNMDKVAPTDYSYAALPPEFGRTMDVGLTNWAGGYGKGWQEKWDGAGYRLARGADASTGEVMKGPAIANATLTNKAATGVTGFFEIGAGLYAVNGRYIHKRTTDADWNTGQKDFGVGKGCLDAIHIKSTLGGDIVLLAMGDTDPIQKFDGTTWTVHAQATLLYGRAWAIVGVDLYRANATHQLAKLDILANPFAQENWSAVNAHVIGDQTSPITRLAATSQGVLAAIKTDGIYSLDAVGDAIAYHPFLKPAPDAANGIGTGTWMNDLYVPFASGLMKLDPGFGMGMVGPERMPENDTEARGRITCAAGHGSLILYAGMKNPDTDDGYLLKMTPDGVWHASIVIPWTDRWPTAMHVSTIGAAAGHQRMYVGFSDGGVSWFELPCGANPAACTAYRFQSADGTITTPRMMMGFSADQKTIDSLSIKGRSIDSGDNLTLSYRVDDLGATFTTIGSAIVRNQDEVQLPDNTVGNYIEVQAALKSGDTTSSPILTALGVTHWLNPRQQEIYQCQGLCADGVIRRDATPIRRSGADLLRVLRSLQVGEVEILLPTEERITARITELGQTNAWNERLRRWQAAVSIEFAELTTVEIRGTWARVGVYTWNEIAGRTWAELLLV